MAVSVAPLTTTVMDAVDDRHAGVASGINNATARLAGALAVALLGAIAVSVMRGALDHRLSELGTAPGIGHLLRQQASRLAEARVPGGVSDPERMRLTRALAESFLESFRVSMLVAAVLALLSALCARLMIEPAIERATKR